MSYELQLKNLQNTYQANDRKIIAGRTQLDSLLDRMEEELGVTIEDPTKFDFSAAKAEIAAKQSKLKSKIEELVTQGESLVRTP